MIFTRIGSGIIYNGTLYTVGMKVAAVSERSAEHRNSHLRCHERVGG